MKVLLVMDAFYPAIVYGGPIISTYQLVQHFANNTGQHFAFSVA
jgi:hypothetical protein